MAASNKSGAVAGSDTIASTSVLGRSGGVLRRRSTSPASGRSASRLNSRRRRAHPSGRTGCAWSRSTRCVTRLSFMPRATRRSPITGATCRAMSSRGQRATSGVSALTRRSGAWSALGMRSPPGRSALATRTAAAGYTCCSRVALGAGRAWVRRSSATHSGASGAQRAQRRAWRRRGERHRRAPPLRARRDGARARLGDLREGARRCCVSGDQRVRMQATRDVVVGADDRFRWPAGFRTAAASATLQVVPIGRRASRRRRSLFARAIVRLACPARPLPTASAHPTPPRRGDPFATKAITWSWRRYDRFD